MLVQGRGAMTLFPQLAAAHPENEAYAALVAVGPAMYGTALVTGLMLWGLGIWWLFHAVVTVSTHYMTFDIAFNVSFVSIFNQYLFRSFSVVYRWAHGELLSLSEVWRFSHSVSGTALTPCSLSTPSSLTELHSCWNTAHYRVVGSAMTLAVFVMWWLVALPTARGFLRGTLFEAPCLTTLPEEYRKIFLEKQVDSEAKSSREPSNLQDWIYLILSYIVVGFIQNIILHVMQMKRSTST